MRAKPQAQLLDQASVTSNTAQRRKGTGCGEPPRVPSRQRRTWRFRPANACRPDQYQPGA
jgi:hypothetical protein